MIVRFYTDAPNGIIAINIDEGDALLDVVLTDGTKRIFIATHNGFAIRFDEKNARPMGRATRGTRAVRWGVAGRIIWAWILTMPASAAVAAIAYFATHWLVRALGG